MKAIKGFLAITLIAALSAPSASAFAATTGASATNGSTSASSVSASRGASLSLSASKSKRGFVKVGSYYYYYKNGKKIKSKWRTIKGKRYYFKANGRAATGACKIKGTYYVFGAKGALLKGSKIRMVKVGNSRYYVNKLGKAVPGWKRLSGQDYYFKVSGLAAIGSCKIKGSYYIFNSKGQLTSAKKMKTVKVGKKYYLVGPEGKAVTGWQVISGKLYHADKTGLCACGKTYDKVPFNSYGYAKPTNNRTKLLIKAKEVLAEITTDKMTTNQKIVACFEYSNAIPWIADLFPPNSVNSTKKKSTPEKLATDWQIDWSLETFKTQRTNCWGQVCVFSSLVKAMGKTPYLVFDRGVHLSVRIDGKHWDRVGDIRGGSKPYFSTLMTKIFW